KIGSSSLMIGASVVALTAGLLLAFGPGNGGQAAGTSAGKLADEGGPPIPERPDWNWDVRPILSQNCFACHGPGTQKAGLGLDLQKSAFGPIPEDKKKRAVVPGYPVKSELYRRITSTDVDYKMPPKDSHKTLSARDVAILERWITQGAVYKQHWAFIPPSIVK